MKHLVNVGLLLFFATLLGSGLMRFLQPFSLTVTRVHITFGFGLAVLIGFHLSGRGKYFRGVLLGPSSGAPQPREVARQVAGAMVLWVVLLVAALWNFAPVTQLIGYSYESRHALDIFRPHDRIAYLPVDSGLRVHRGATADTGLRIEFDWGPVFGADVGDFDPGGDATQLAIWAENEEGGFLETIFVSEVCAASREPHWGGRQQRREDILPVWSARYTGPVEPATEGEVDGVSSATPTRDFSMDGHLKTDALPFALYVEVNAPNDPNDAYRSDGAVEGQGDAAKGIGQPSVVYEARVYPSDDRRYYLMDLIGHSGGDLPAGEIDYDTSGLTTAKRLVDKVLVNVTWPDESESTR